MPTELTAALDAVWQPARRTRRLGPVSAEALHNHAAGFVVAVESTLGPGFDGIGLDLGSGVGVPGVFLAWALPGSSWVLLDAAQRSCDHAEAAVRMLGLSERVVVRHGRGDELSPLELGGPFDVVSARLLGRPAETLELGLSVVRDDGILVTSVRAEDRDWWKSLPGRLAGVGDVDVSQRPDGMFATVTRHRDWDDSLPRRPAARRRRPLV